MSVVYLLFLFSCVTFFFVSTGWVRLSLCVCGFESCVLFLFSTFPVQLKCDCFSHALVLAFTFHVCFVLSETIWFVFFFCCCCFLLLSNFFYTLIQSWVFHLCHNILLSISLLSVCMCSVAHVRAPSSINKNNIKILFFVFVFASLLLCFFLLQFLFDWFFCLQLFAIISTS